MLTHILIKRIERSLKYSVFEGMAYGAMQGTGEHFVSAYAVALKASNTQLALLSSAPNFLGAVAQSMATHTVRLLGSRKRQVVLFAALSGFMWLPILSIEFFIPEFGAGFLIGLLALYAVFNAPISPAWGSIMAEVVPDRVRGQYFGLRSRWSTVANMVAFLVAGVLLFVLKNYGLLGFAIVFVMAFAFRMLSVALLATLLELPHDQKEDDRLSLWDFLRQLPTTNLGRVTLYLFSVNLVVNLASPFFIPYMLKDLKMDYLTFTALEMVSILVTLWVVPHWGAAADRTGNRRLITIAGLLISMVPLWWLVSGNGVFLAFAQAYNGFAWAGFNLVSTNLVYDATSNHTRTAYLAYLNAGTAIASSLGALLGALLITQMPALMGSAILTMFLISGVLRLLMAAVFMPRVQEVRRVRTIPAAELFHIMLGGRTAHRAPHQGRLHHNHHLHGHKDE